MPISNSSMLIGSSSVLIEVAPFKFEGTYLQIARVEGGSQGALAAPASAGSSRSASEFREFQKHTICQRV